MKVYIVVCCGKGKNAFSGKPVCGTFGCFLSMREARTEMERLKTVPNHFADDAEWTISIDQVVKDSRDRGV